MTTHRIAVNEDHFQQWIADMYTTNKPQATGKLAKMVDVMVDNHVEQKVGYCCLGLGSVMINCPVQMIDPRDDDEYDKEFLFGTSEVTDLAPPEFIHWLTGDRYIVTSESDLIPDWPDGLDVTQGQALYTLEGEFKRISEGSQRAIRDLGAATMNDDGLTFAQIADVFRYFGVGAIKPRNGQHITS